MNTKQRLLVACTAISMMACAAAAYGSVFVNPPENNSSITWDTPSPYQRDVFLDFSTNPVGPAGPIPAADYEGTDDSQWWGSDYVAINTGGSWDQATGTVLVNGSLPYPSPLEVHIANPTAQGNTLPGITRIYEEVII